MTKAIDIAVLNRVTNVKKILTVLIIIVPEQYYKLWDRGGEMGNGSCSYYFETLCDIRMTSAQDEENTNNTTLRVGETITVSRLPGKLFNTARFSMKLFAQTSFLDSL